MPEPCRRIFRAAAGMPERCRAPCASKTRRNGRIVLDLRDIRIGKGVEGQGKRRKKRGRDFVDALVGTLGRQPHGDHQLIVLFVLQRADWVG